jgi:rare lipoprotein A
MKIFRKKRNHLFLIVPILFSFIKSEPTQCVATWYDLHGFKTASGTKMHRDSLTAAYNQVPLNSKLKITNPINNKSCIVLINDRVSKKYNNRIDLSYGAFGIIANHNQGKINVIIEKL